MNRKNSTKPTKNNSSRKIIFNLILILFPLILIIIFELLLRVVGYGDNLSLFIQHPDKEYKAYRVVNPEIGKKYFQQFEYTEPAKDIFLKKKADDVFRIFVMGSSTVVGFPYDNNLMFSRILHERLLESYPEQKFEVVNTAITAINSFSLLDFMPEILEQQPDAILFYAGHNEFYGAFGAGSNEAISHNPTLIKLHIKLMDFRVYQLTKNVIGSVVGLGRKAKSAGEKRGTLMARIVKDADIVYGSELYNQGISKFETNLNEMLSMAASAAVPVYIGDLVSNIRNIKPFRSIKTDSLEGADYYYQLAKKQDEQGEIKAAFENYTKARDYDGIRFRASSDINRIIRELAKKHQAIIVPTLAFFEKNSPDGIIGDNLLTEHVHPNINGQFLLAELFFKELRESQIIDNDVNYFTHKSFAYFAKNYGYSQIDYLIGNHRVTNLKYHWPFRDESDEYIDYRLVYQPSSFLDSLAFSVMVNSNESLTNAHRLLAEMYEQKGDYMNAFKEYNALTKINPYWPPYFRSAANCLIKLNDLAGALKYYERSNSYGESYFAHFRAGEICLIKNDLDKAIFHFEKAVALAADDELMTVLSKLYITLLFNNQKDKAEVVKMKINNIDPYREIAIPPRFFAFMQYIPKQIQNYIDEANEQLEKGNSEEAITLLLQSLQIYDTPIANRKLGELFYKKKEFDRSLFHLKRVYNDFKGDYSYLHYLVIVNLSNRNTLDAQRALEQIKKVAPDYPQIDKLQGYIDSSSS